MVWCTPQKRSKPGESERFLYNRQTQGKPDKLFACALQKKRKLYTAYYYSLTWHCLCEVHVKQINLLQCSLLWDQPVWTELNQHDLFSCFLQRQTDDEQPRHKTAPPHFITMRCNSIRFTWWRKIKPPSLQESKRSYAYIEFYTGCWSLSLTAGWSGHLSWHRLCAQIGNETSLCHHSLKTSYTETRWKKSFTKAQSNNIAQRSCRCKKEKLKRNIETCLTYGLKDSHANILW